MADERIKDLLDEVLEVQLNALIDTLYLAVDDTTFTDANKILLRAILYEAIVADNLNDYQAMTPQSFYNSIMTTVRMGIQRLATNGEVTSKSGVGLLNTAHQVLMQTQWKLDWFQSNPIPDIYSSDNLAVPNAMVFDSTFTNSLSAGQAVAINPVLPVGRRFDYVTFSYAARANLSNGGFGVLEYSGSTESYFLVTPIYLDLSADGREISVRASLARSLVSVSLSINAVIVIS